MAKPRPDPATSAGSASSSSVEMAGWIDTIGGFVARTPGFWQWLAKVETSSNRDALDAIRIEKPIYVTGLARSGSTILLELLESHPATGSHRYRDFPLVMTPVFWNRAFANIYKDTTPVERSHKDRILVTPDSPEALEEILWMRFFEGRHATERNQVLDERTSNEDFETFYRDHIKKILLIREAKRYLAKGNYNVTRLAYLAKLFPDVRIVVPVRSPEAHIASLQKQHRLFCEEERQNPKVLRHMQRVGHFEFGLDRRPLNTGDADLARRVETLWRERQDIEGLAHHWAGIYGFLLDQLEAAPGLKRQVMIVRYEDLCTDGEATLAAILDHVELAAPAEQIKTLAARLSAPTYYSPDFSDAEREAINSITGPVATRLGY